MTTLTAPRAGPAGNARQIALWLLACAAMVFAMAVIGAITRLTESGLSITEWKPITGALPPLSEAAWQAAFAKYRATPEFQLKHSYMDLADFKAIYFWEWLHRLWGRLIGLVFALPLLFLWIRGRIPRALLPRLLLLLGLGALQGAIGWFMVQSGLADRPDVSHYRLALHLLTALLIYAALLWVAIGLLMPGAGAPAGLRHHGLIGLALLGVTILWGAFVAGLDAGQAYNSWPLMDGRLVPPEMWTLVPVWLNPTENTAAVQFIHRWLAVITAAVLLLFAARIARWGAPQPAKWLAAAVVLQVVLGIATLLMKVPVALGAAHQAGALLVLTFLIWTLAEIRQS
jgi:cytochrome c oxidase assembly protein subunit 15